VLYAAFLGEQQSFNMHDCHAMCASLPNFAANNKNAPQKFCDASDNSQGKQSVMLDTGKCSKMEHLPAWPQKFQFLALATM
jgi:hypothetical protein